MNAEEILVEVYFTPAIHGVREIGVRTQEAHRGKGYGAQLSDHGIKICEQMGDRVYWNTARQNLASLAIARNLGFQHERVYPIRIWRTTAAKSL